MISKSEFFYCRTYEFDFSGDLVEGCGGGGRVVDTLYGGLPRLCLTLACITGKDFTNIPPVMGCHQVICGHLDIFRVIWARLHWFKPIWGQLRLFWHIWVLWTPFISFQPHFGGGCADIRGDL